MDKAKKNISITLKLAIFMGLTTAVFLAACISISYLSISDHMRESAGMYQTQIAKLLASSIDDNIKEKIETVKRSSVKEDIKPIEPAVLSEVSVGSVKFDDKTGTWALPLNVGTYNTSLNIADICGPLKDFKTAQAADVAIVDDRAYLVYAPGVKPFSNKFCGYNELQKALNTDANWAIMNGIYSHQENVFVSFYPLKQEILSRSNVKWWVFVIRDADTVMQPLNGALIRIAIIGAVIVVIAVLSGIILGKTIGKPIVKLHDDIEQLSAELSKADEKKKAFSADLANALAQLRHVVLDIKQKLKNIIDMSATNANEKQKEIVNSENNSIDVLLKDVENLSDIARIESGKFDLNMQPVDIKEVIKSSIFVFEPKVRGKGLDLKVNIPKGRVDVYADISRIKQVLFNLMDNAIKFTDKGGVDISVKELRDDIEFSISDTGPGMQKEDIDSIFKRMAAIDTSKMGMALSIYISKAIIQMHNGKIWVESSPGRGARFSFRLPKHKA